MSPSIIDLPEVTNLCHQTDNSEVNDYFDLSMKNLLIFPNELLMKIQNVKFCYLQENYLSNLPETFFSVLPHLQWLDLRNNNLESLPTAGLSAHQHLQVVLLQSNLIKNVPEELALVPNLKGLQLAGNPVENIPFEVIAQGFPAVVKFLRKLVKAHDTLLPVLGTVVMNPSKSATYSDANFVGNTSNSFLCEHLEKSKLGNSNKNSLGNLLNVKGYLYSGNNIQQKIGDKKAGKVFKVLGQVSSASCRIRRKSCLKPHQDKCVTPKQVNDKCREETEKSKLREILERQSRMLQRIKEKEAIKLWRNKSSKVVPIELLDNYQQSRNLTYLGKTPFDVDADMLKMLNRADLYKSLKELEEVERRKICERIESTNYCTSQDIEKQINDIKIRLGSMKVKDHEETNESQQHKLKNRIDEIKKLRLALIKLHGDNLRVQ